MNRGVTLKTRRAALLWTIYSSFVTHAGRPVRRALQLSRRVMTMVCTRSWVACCVRNGLIFLVLNCIWRHHRVTEGTCSKRVNCSSIITPMFLATLERTSVCQTLQINQAGWAQTTEPFQWSDHYQNQTGMDQGGCSMRRIQWPVCSNGLEEVGWKGVESVCSRSATC